MASPREYPQLVKAFAALGEVRLREIGAAAKIALGADRDPTTLALALLVASKNPADLAPHYAHAEYEVFGAALGIPPSAEWKPSISAEEIAKLPSYLQPSHDGDVAKAMFERVTRPRAALRPVAGPDRFPMDWPELASLAMWKKADQTAVMAALATTLGFEASGSRLTDKNSGITYVAIAGGTFRMGIAAAEKKELNKRAKALGVDAMEHAKAIAKQAAPEHEVTIAPFLISESLVGAPLDTDDAAEFVLRAGRRLPSEAEWEYLARGNGGAWLSLGDDNAPFGLRGLSLGEWVDDGWHETYKKAPADGSAWEPRTRPEVVRSGAGALHPWQNPGEELLLHVTVRERSNGLHGVRLAIDLPAR